MSIFITSWMINGIILQLLLKIALHYWFLYVINKLHWVLR